MSSTSSNASTCICVVDDDPLVRSLLRHTLQAAGYVVLDADSTEAALALIRDSRPDLVSIDVELGGASGIELAQALRDQGIPFLFISVHDENEILCQAQEHGAVGYLTKPFEVAQILPTFTTALNVAAQIRQHRDNADSFANALQAGRETNMAIGLLMRAYQTDRHRAYDVLRTYARTQRRKVNDVASDILRAEELFNALGALFKQPEH